MILAGRAQLLQTDHLKIIGHGKPIPSARVGPWLPTNLTPWGSSKKRHSGSREHELLTFAVRRRAGAGRRQPALTITCARRRA
jgi:hypothetical protein